MAEEPTLLRKKRDRSKYPLHWAIVPLIFLLPVGWAAWHFFGPETESGPYILPGYIASTEVFEQESARFYGQATKNQEAEEKFQLAAESMSKRDFGGAAALLEEASKQTAIPVIFNNLGVLYAHMDDPSRTANAFREALARDEGYDPARKNLERFKEMHLSSRAYPVTQEIEPNNTVALNNLISLGKPVDGAIDANGIDVDWYRVTTPAPPRDLIRVEIANKSKTLAPSLSLFEENMTPIGAVRKSDEPGVSFATTLSPPPNSVLYLKIESTGGTAGGYTLTVSALKAFDTYEPNDHIFSASKIATGQAIEANIMDAQDTDFYSFVSPRTGTVEIEIQNRSSTLIPALTTYAPDMRNTGFGPDVTKPGAGLHHSIELEENRTYFVQVWSRDDTAGSYTLIIK